MKEKNVKTPSLIRILAVAITIILLIGVGNNYFSSDKEAKNSAESKMNQLVYTQLGVVPKRYYSNVIYKENNKRVVIVKYGLSSTTWDGSACFYVNDKYIINYTNIMSADYDYQGNIQSVKALFGI